MMSSGSSTFCCLIFRLGGTGLGLTEEVEDVGDLHRGELLAVLAVTGGGESLKSAMRCGFSMAQIGEFSFIIASLGLSLGVISNFHITVR